MVKLPGDSDGTSWDSETYLAAQLQLAGEIVPQLLRESSAPLWSGRRAVVGHGWPGAGAARDPPRSQPVLGFGRVRDARGNSEHPAIMVDSAFTGGAMIDLVCHEFMHGVWEHLGYPYDSPEGRALDESLADIFRERRRVRGAQ